MKNFKKICFSLLVVFLLVFSVPSILPFSDDIISVEAATKPKLNKKTATLIKGQTLTLKVSGTKTKVKWSSSNKKVANVNSKGKIVAKSKGVSTDSLHFNVFLPTLAVILQTPFDLATKNPLK